MARGRPRKEFDEKAFNDLIGLGCNQREICWFFRDESGKPVNIDTLSRWCKRKYGLNFQEYSDQNSGIVRNITLRRNQLALSKRSAAMAIFMGKNYLGQSDAPELSDGDRLADRANLQINAIAALLNMAKPSESISDLLTEVDADDDHASDSVGQMLGGEQP